MDKLIPSSVNLGHQIFIWSHHFILTLLIPRHKSEHFHIPQGHIGISLHHAEACPFSVYLSGTCILIDTYMHLLFSCCRLDPDHVTSTVTYSGFTCPTSATEPESLWLRAFSGCWILLCTFQQQAECVGEDVHISDSCPQKIASGKQDITAHLFCPSGSRTQVCSEQLPTVHQQGVALADNGIPDLITHPFLAASLSQFPTLLLLFPGNTN